MNLFKLLNSNNYFSVNREIAHIIGLHATIILSEIIDKYQYFCNQGLAEDDWFYLTVDTVEERTCLAKDAQKGAIEKLKKLGFLECEQRGMPAKRYFKVDKGKIQKWFDSLPCSRKPANKIAETRQQERGFPSNKNAGFPPTAPIYIYKEPYEEPNNEILGTEVCDKPSIPTASPISFSFERESFENINPDHIRIWKETYPCIDPEQELKKMVQWCMSNTRKAKSKSQWRKFITTWLSNANEKQSNLEARKQGISPHSATPPSNEARVKNLETVKEMKILLSERNMPGDLVLQGDYVLSKSQHGDTLSLDLNPDSFFKAICSWYKI